MCKLKLLICKILIFFIDKERARAWAMAMAGRGYDLDTKRRSTAKGSSTGLVPVCPTKVEACKSILFCPQ